MTTRIVECRPQTIRVALVGAYRQLWCRACGVFARNALTQNTLCDICDDNLYHATREAA
jgi:hypothetical protein